MRSIAVAAIAAFASAQNRSAYQDFWGYQQPYYYSTQPWENCKKDVASLNESIAKLVESAIEQERENAKVLGQIDTINAWIDPVRTETTDNANTISALSVTQPLVTSGLSDADTDITQLEASLNSRSTYVGVQLETLSRFDGIDARILAIQSAIDALVPRLDTVEPKIATNAAGILSIQCRRGTANPADCP